MIRSVRDKDTAKVLAGEFSKKFGAITRQAIRRLQALHYAKTLNDLRLPGYRLEKLSGDREGQHSIRINDQYRICSEWREDGVYNVEVTDYH